MRLTKDGDGLLILFEMLIFFVFQCDKKEKFLLYKECRTKIQFYFFYIIQSITCVMNPMITGITTYPFITYRNLFFTNLACINDHILQEKTKLQ